MPANTAKGYPYPLGTDRLMDGDDSIHSLATAVETLLGVAASGTVVVTLTTGAFTGNTAITFPVGRFATAPMGFATCHSGPTAYYGSAGQPTTSGMLVYATHRAGTTVGSTTNLTCSWFAIG